MRKVLVTGGGGYVGNLLTPRLLAEGHDVTVYDIFYFGRSTLPLNHPRLRVVEADIRNVARFREAVAGQDAVLHLACISNDASFVLDERLSTSINLEAFEPLVIAAKDAGVRRFIYCSSSSVYGVSDAPDVTEDHPLVPLTLYNKYKAMCEPLLWKHMADDFTCVTLRPATICGYSPRMRLDLSVNILTNHAVTRNAIDVFGGSQKRPNLHIKDMVDAYLLFLRADHAKIHGEVFNIGVQNLSIMQIAEKVKHIVEQELPGRPPIDIKVVPTDDNRSYHVNSDKVRRVLNFIPKLSVEDAIRDICAAFRAGKLPNSMNNDWYYNVRTMKALKAA
jgi:nucleoside-diphosphate-sugar epimerase